MSLSTLYLKDEDKCCRAHDLCSLQIAPGECLKSICNYGTFSRFHCGMKMITIYEAYQVDILI